MARVDGPGTVSALARCLAHGPPASAHAEHEPGPCRAPSGNTTMSAPCDAASTMLAFIFTRVAAVSPQTGVKLTQATVTTDSSDAVMFPPGSLASTVAVSSNTLDRRCDRPRRHHPPPGPR